MSLIINHLQAATTMVQAAQLKLRSPSIADIISEKERLEYQLSVVPPYAREAIQEELDALNEKLREEIENDYEARWNNMSEEDKKAWLQEIHEQIADELGLDHLELQFEQLEDSFKRDLKGEYSHRDNEIRIDIDNLLGKDSHSSFNDLLDTVAHETRHHYQNQIVALYKDGKFDEIPPHISHEQIEAWKDNRENPIKRSDYYNIESYRKAYYTRATEIDARGYANDYVDTFYENEIENYSG